MSWTTQLAAQPPRLWRFLGFFQSPFLRVLHATIVVLVLLQLVSSAFMGHGSPANWYHYLAGILLCFLGVFQIGYSLKMHGLRYFFPYLWGDIEQLKVDIKKSLHMQLIGPRPKGLPAVIQGLGLGALLLAAFSGFAWLWLWRLHDPWAHVMLETHKWCVQLLFLYFIGHGGMALLHFIHWQRTVKM